MWHHYNQIEEEKGKKVYDEGKGLEDCEDGF